MTYTLLLIAIAGCASFLLPCTAPFVALAATVALHAGARRALVVVAAAWALDECIGFAFFGYPRTSESFALAALALVCAALAVTAASLVRARGGAPWLAFAGAAVAFEAAFALGTFALGMSLAMFAPAIDAWVIGANVLFFVAFELGYRLEDRTARA